MHLLGKFLTVAVTIAVRDESLDCGPGKVRDAARTLLLANAYELTELVFRYAKVHQTLSRL